MEITCQARGNCRGVCAAELIIALAIAAILLLLALPSFARLHASTELSAAKNALILGLQRARAEAISTGRNLIVCPSTDGQRCSDSNDWSSGWLVYRDDNRNGRFDAIESLLLTQRIDEAKIRVRSNDGRRRVTYRSLGESEGANTSFVLCSRHQAGEGRQVIVANSGRVRALSFAPAAACSST